MRIGWMATVQILIPAEDSSGNHIENQGMACDYVHGLLEESGLVDWSYLKAGGQFLTPTVRYYNEPYQEGEIFE